MSVACGHKSNFQLLFNSRNGLNGGYGSGSDNGNVWSQGGKDLIPAQVGAHLTNQDHLEAIHEHLRYVYDRLDDLLDRVHFLEAREQQRSTNQG